ncbi:MAG: GNAT family N-acetyltransferase [Bacteroidota bacterium]
MLKIVEITSPEDFRSLHQAWNALLRRSRSNTLFLTWEWLYTWWEIYGARLKPCILLAQTQDGELRGIAPLMVTRPLWPLTTPHIQFIGSHSVSSQYLDFICSAGFEHDVISSFLTHLLHSSEPHLLSFFRIPHDSPTVDFLSTHDPRTRIPLAALRSEDSYYVPLSHCWATYLSQLGPNTRRNIRRYRHRFEHDLHGSFVELHSRPDHWISTLASLHQSRMNSVGKVGSFASLRFRQFHERLADRAAHQGWLRIYLLRVKNDYVAASYGYVYQNKYYAYSMGFDPKYEKHSIGFVLLSYCFESCSREGVGEIDLLSTGEYKERWGVRARQKLSLTIGRHRGLDIPLRLRNTPRIMASCAKRLLPEMIYQKLRNLKQRALILANRPLR